MEQVDNRITEKFGKRVRKLRMERGLSQEKLAFISNMHRTYIGGIERGERNPSLKIIEAIAKALNIHMSELCKLEE